MENKVYDIAVIGSGAAGTMAALRGVLNYDDVILFPGTAKHKKKSRALWVYKVENVPGLLGYKKAIEQPNRETLDFLSRPPYAEKFNWLKNVGADEITKNEDGIFTILDSKGVKHQAKYVVVTTGVMDVQPHFDGSIQPILPYANAQIVDYCLRCDGHHVIGKETSIIGHTSGAAWVAVMLYERYQTPSMTILTNGEEPQFDEETTKLLNLYNIEVITDEIVDVMGDAKASKLEGYIFKNGNIFNTEFSFVSLGMIVYNELIEKLGAELDGRGFAVTNAKGETNVENLYVAGDLRAGIKKQIYTAQDSAVDSLDDINGKIRRQKRNEKLKAKNLI